MKQPTKMYLVKKARAQKWHLGAFPWLFKSVYTQSISGKKQETAAQVPLEERYCP